MATFNIQISCSNVTGSTNFKVKYRLMGDNIWTSFLIAPSSGTTVTTPQLLNNRIYEFQIQNLNSADNALSTISQQIGITDPGAVLSPTSTSVGYSFANLSQDMDSYTVQLATVADPGTIIATHILPAGAYPGTLSDVFTGLMPFTQYRMTITPVANQFSAPFLYVFTTSNTNKCADPINVIVQLS
jgi:hypothetical protein